MGEEEEEDGKTSEQVEEKNRKSKLEQQGAGSRRVHGNETFTAEQSARSGKSECFHLLVMFAHISLEVARRL